MLVLENLGKIRGDATEISVIDFTIHGVIGSTLTLLANGQISSTSIVDMYTNSSGSSAVISSIVLVNTSTSDRQINLYLTPNGGTARRLIPKNMTLKSFYSMMFDGAKLSVVSTTGTIQSGAIPHTASIWLPSEAAYLPATNPAMSTEITGSTTYAGWTVLAFDKTTAQMAVWRVPISDYDGGNIVVTAYSKPATTPAGNVTLQYNIFTVGITNDQTFDTAILVDTNVNISHNMNTGTLSTEIAIANATIDPANVATDNILCIGIQRDVASDDLDSNGQLLGILLEYTKV